ncbi:MAG: hypothetical protein GWM90_29815, partial [Gemmatimonadetes bacterium]|nr:hypothetical protein [Gemmatimonadota bacterium]NIQ59278.1 hypothetical protein [Gemmatimonadota bacterium]NIR41338.1 hypothetical protein [Actinomycetota bacterium]NIU79465.1 hypothetical protein [Gammaproteobacteria bacterium]NIX48114.1 hypothetical protein [Gemmatimonadota bacterium]
DATLAVLSGGALATLRKVPLDARELAETASGMVGKDAPCALHPWDEEIARELLARRVGSA